MVCLPAEKARGFGLFHQGGTVLVSAGEGGRRVFALNPRDAEAFCGSLKEAIFRATGRGV